MNNLTLGGRDPRNHNAPFAYYETIAGGMGARPSLDGISAVHTHLTNSWNTPIEVFEQTYPVRVRSYSIRSMLPASAMNAHLPDSFFILPLRRNSFFPRFPADPPARP